MCTSHLEDWSSLLTEQCGDGKEDLEAMWRCSSSVQCAEIVFVSGSGERVGAIGMAFSDHISRNRFHGSEHMTCWSFHFNLATYLCMGLVLKFTSLVDVLFGFMASTLEAMSNVLRPERTYLSLYKSAFKTLGSVAKQVFTIVTWQNFNNSGVELAFLNLYDFLMRLVLAKGLGPMRAFQQ